MRVCKVCNECNLVRRRKSFADSGLTRPLDTVQRTLRTQNIDPRRHGRYGLEPAPCPVDETMIHGAFVVEWKEYDGS